MLGVVFTELLEMVESKFGPDMTDDVIDDAGVSGAYTAVGNYPFSDLVALVGALEKRSGLPAASLIEVYGEHLFGRFSERYPSFFVDIGGALEFLEGIENRIHTEVRKLYPEAQLPSFDCERPAPDTLLMHYKSPKCLGPLAVGLIRGCGNHFNEPLTITPSTSLESSSITFTVQRQ